MSFGSHQPGLKAVRDLRRIRVRGRTVDTALALPSVALLTRVPEPELMDEPTQARAYSEGDFDEPHQAFVEQFRTRFPDLAARPFTAIDLGCGPGDVTARFAQAHPEATMIAVDGAPAMLELAAERLARGGLEHRVRLERRRLPDPSIAGRSFDVGTSNSLLHHLADPGVLWAAIEQCVAPGGAVFVMDLSRPDDEESLEKLVAEHARGAPEVLRRDFAASLRAAYRVDEVREQLATAGLSLTVEQITDRHFIAWGRR
jgi:ubiquinone/menaquinone biosynthesis C-methylase UbiE